MDIFETVKEMLSLPSVQITMWGEESKQVYSYFVKLHPKYKVIRNKVWGVGLLPLPDTFEEYLRGKDKQALRTNRNRCLNSGFYFGSFNPAERLEEILDINHSIRDRQGRPMHPDYLNIDSLRRYCIGKSLMYGVFNAEGILKAYAYTPVCGEVFVFSRLLGHGDCLDLGIMYLLVSEVIREMIGLKQAQGYPLWAMYDTFFGAKPGLRYFKERLGFKPYKVKWRWIPARN